MPPFISIGGYFDPPSITHLSVEVARGELVVLTGGPGSGKSNLIKSLAGIRTIRKGSVKILGARPGAIRTQRESVFVFQKGNFSPDLPIRLQLERRAALYRGVPTRAVSKDVDLSCEEMDILDLLDCFPGDLNRSQLKLFSLSILSLTDPAVVILDEPMSDLSSVAVSSALSVILPKIESAAVLALSQKRSPLVSRADRVVDLI